MTVTMGRRTKNLLLASGVTLASLLIGVEVAAYLTVPPIHVTSEGDAMAVFDREIGMTPHPSAHTKRIYPAIKDRATLAFDVYTDERGARVDGPGRRAAARADIVVVGCSFSWGYALANADTYASRLARELGASVSNFAQPSYGTVQSLQMLKRNRDLAPKLFVYGIIAHHSERNVSPCAPSYYPFCLDVSHVEWDRAGQAPDRRAGERRRAPAGAPPDRELLRSGELAGAWRRRDLRPDCLRAVGLERARRDEEGRGAGLSAARDGA